MKLRMPLLVLVVALGGSACILQSEEIEIFRGVPEVKYEVSKETSNRDNIKGDKQKSFEVVIMKSGNDYYWKSREGRKLIFLAHKLLFILIIHDFTIHL